MQISQNNSYYPQPLPGQIPVPQGYDYIGDNIFGDNSEYSSQDIAMLFNALTGQNYSSDDIEQKFGKDRITDFDLYEHVDSGLMKDGYLNPNEVLDFMALNPIEDQSFEYLGDDKTSYSMEEVADLIKQQTGKIINPEDLSKLVDGRTEMTDFEMMVLLDHNRNGKVSSVEMDTLISSFDIQYDIDDGEPAPDEPDETKSLYRGDGQWSYTTEEFKDRLENEFGIDVTDEEITDVFGTTINDRAIDEKIDIDNDGYISTSEINNAFGKTPVEPTDIEYLSDDKTFYSSEDVAGLLSQATGQDVTAADVEALTGGQDTITDEMMFNLFDRNKNGTVEISEAEALLTDGAQTSFDYLADEKTSYTAEELSEELKKIDVDASVDDIIELFGSETITDDDILQILDNPFSGFKDGKITKLEVKLLQMMIFFKSWIIHLVALKMEKLPRKN